ncbi:MAG: ribonuclease Y [Clostridia bacterium]
MVNSVSTLSVVPTSILVILIVVSIAIGVGAGIALSKYLNSSKLGKARTNAVKILEQAYSDAKTVKKEAIAEAKDEALQIKQEIDKEVKERKSELQRAEDRIIQKEENISKKEELIDKKQEQIELSKQKIENKENELAEIINEQKEIKNKITEELEKASGMKKEEAKAELVKRLTEDAKKDAAKIVRDIEDEAREEGDKKAKEIVCLAIQKCATDHCSEITVSSVAIPSEEMKGRIIGREGRNIRAIEAATGVDLIIDDTPDAITISGFDPVRREIAKISLEKLILDGRIHPTRIEEIIAKVQKDMDITIKEAGEKAAEEAGIFGIHPELIKILGRLKYRSSYGQNVLKHSLETSYIAGLIAGELGADVKIAKRGGLLHDIGKAVDQEYEGTHVTIGVDLAKKFKEIPAVVHCIEAHHGNVEYGSLEAIIVQVADAISSSRPGARRESLENYIKRLQKLEEIANGFDGVEKSFAIQAGREVRIIVKPEEVSDDGALFIAKEIAKKIEDSMDYPGQIKVNVIRESRSVEYAK